MTSGISDSCSSIGYHTRRQYRASASKRVGRYHESGEARASSEGCSATLQFLEGAYALRQYRTARRERVGP
eukprot:1168960-Rhodomonas_salina.2